MSGIGRRDLMLGAVAVGASLAAGCNKTSGGGAPLPDDVSIGAADAPATLMEFASVMCPICKAWHDALFAQVKQHYIDTGKVRFVLREFPTGDMPPSVVVASFQVARCGNATPQQYFNRVDAFYQQQPEFFLLRSNDDVKAKLIELGQASGLSEQQVNDCIADPGGATRMQRFSENGAALGVTGTPTLFLNGRKLDPTPTSFAELSHLIDAAIAGH